MSLSQRLDDSALPAESQTAGVRGRIFRPEIQFLRALAVVAVVVYHIQPAWLPGGFIGVDVFFVISGYLITAGILRSIENNGEFSLAQFWANRARRILPAASATIVVSVLVGLWLLTPSQLVETGWQALASVLYVQNLYLAWQSVDYLAGDQDPSVYQHFWSLSVEEQFYVVWPLLVVLASFIAGLVRNRYSTGEAQHRRRFRAITVILFACLVGASLAYSIIAVAAGDQTAYFVTWTRLWELGAGGMLACVLIDWRAMPSLRLVLQWLGIITIVVTALTYSDATPFPGLAALAPVLGTMSVIAAGRTEGFGTLRWLTDFVVFQRLGDWSYSLYLWHFPIFVFAIHVWGKDIPWWVSLSLLGASLALAVGSYYSIERPILSWEWLKPRWVITLACTVATLIITAVVALVPVWVGQARIAYAEAHRVETVASPELSTPAEFGPGYASLRPDSYETWFYDDKEIEPAVSSVRTDSPTFSSCTQPMPAKSDSRETAGCVIANPTGTKTLALVGDSHMVQWSPGIVEAAKGTDYKVVIYARESCPFSTQVTQAEQTDNRKKCVEPAKQVSRELEKLKPDIVMMTNRVRTDMMPRGDEKDAGTAGYVDVMGPIVESGARLIALEDSPAPVNGWDLGTCLEGNAANPDACDFHLKDSYVGQYTNAALKAAAQQVGDVEFVQTDSLTCADETCPAVIGSTAVYRDSNHITATYSKTTNPWFADLLKLDQ